MIKVPICKRNLNGQPDEVCQATHKRLSTSDFTILNINAVAKTITVKATAKLLDWGFWSCYGDKVVFQCTPHGQSETDVNVYGVPNLLRLCIRTGEKVFDMPEMARIFGSLLAETANDMMQSTAQKRALAHHRVMNDRRIEGPGT